MKVFVVYDSFFGNTEQIAKTISEELKGNHQVYLFKTSEFDCEVFNDVDLLFLGSPTRGFMATKDINEFIKRSKFLFA